MKGLPVGLLDILGAARAKKPEALDAPDDPEVICAPVSGRVVPLAEVGDPAFSQGMLGCGVGIEGTEPEGQAGGSVAFSPVSGTVVADVKTKHALLIKAESGAEVLLHVGVDSVALRGRGFRLFVSKGDRVRAGEPVIAFDRTLLRERGLDDTVIVTVTNPEAFDEVEPVCEQGVVPAGGVVLRAERSHG